MSKKGGLEVKQNIEKTNYVYQFFYNFLYSVHATFYKKIVIIGKKDLPRGESFFVTPSHQNSMMDAMSVLFTIGRPNPVFMARADIFKKRLVARFLYFLKILPVFRIRDGKDSLQNNERIFQETIRIVRNNVPLIIYPEGNHDGHRRFRGVKKGIIRTAFSALEQFEEGKKLYFVPTGIEYNTSYQKSMQNLVVYYGKPLLVNDFYDLYKEDKAKGERQLQLALQERMADQMIHIASKEFYDLYDIVRETACGAVMQRAGVSRDPEQKLYAQQAIIKALDVQLEQDAEGYPQMQDAAYEYRQLMLELKLRDWLFDQEKYNEGALLLESILALLTFPIAIYGRLTNGLQYHIAHRIAAKNKDPQWRSTVLYSMGFTMIPFTHLMLTFLSFIWLDNNWWSLAFLASFVLSGYFSMRYQVWVKKLFGRFRYNRLRLRPSASFKQLVKVRGKLLEFVEKAMS